MSDTYAYLSYGNLYINLTNRCCCDCAFCIRGGGEYFGKHKLWLSREPDANQVIEAIEKHDKTSYNEVVFCGYGESTYRMDCLVEVARAVKDRLDKRIRLNTNGLGKLINGYDIVPKLKGVVDSVSISLNQCTASKYQALVRSIYGEESFGVLIDFARSTKAAGIDTQMSVVAVIPSEDIAGCRRICDELGVRLRVRGNELL